MYYSSITYTDEDVFLGLLLYRHGHVILSHIDKNTGPVSGQTGPVGGQVSIKKTASGCLCFFTLTYRTEDGGFDERDPPGRHWCTTERAKTYLAAPQFCLGQQKDISWWPLIWMPSSFFTTLCSDDARQLDGWCPFPPSPTPLVFLLFRPSSGDSVVDGSWTWNLRTGGQFADNNILFLFPCCSSAVPQSTCGVKKGVKILFRRPKMRVLLTAWFWKCYKKNFQSHTRCWLKDM